MIVKKTRRAYVLVYVLLVVCAMALLLIGVGRVVTATSQLSDSNVLQKQADLLARSGINYLNSFMQEKTTIYFENNYGDTAQYLGSEEDQNKLKDYLISDLFTCYDVESERDKGTAQSKLVMEMYFNPTHYGGLFEFEAGSSKLKIYLATTDLTWENPIEVLIVSHVYDKDRIYSAASTYTLKLDVTEEISTIRYYSINKAEFKIVDYFNGINGGIEKWGRID